MSRLRKPGKSSTPTPVELAAAADIARDAGRWAEAVTLYRDSLKRDPSPSHLWVQFGHALKESGALEEAERAYRSALVRSPDDADGHLQLGHLHKLQGRLDAAAGDYAVATALDPFSADAFAELQGLLARGAILDDASATAVLEALRTRWSPTVEREADGRPSLVFDISDLVGYFRGARLPTGIQRVQIETISSLLKTPPAEAHVQVAAFTEARDGWVTIDSGLFLDICDLAGRDGAVSDPVWRERLDRLFFQIDIAPVLAFPADSWLVNMGTSWWLRNYFLRLREAKRRYGVRYVPFVHDMIPVMAPEHCTRELTQDFISWALGVFAHADRYMTNSESSRGDLIAVAARLGVVIDPSRIAVLPLNADFRRPDHARSPGPSPEQTRQRLNLSGRRFALFVSTIESRKNHLAAFRAWSELIGRHGEARMPLLVCVGNRGWLNDAVFARLEADLPLRRHVRMLSGVADADLANLYQEAEFTLYPSQYEGWGLPVTESLCYGTPVLAADSTSLPEAGGPFATYFREGDQTSLVAALERFVLDNAWREAQAQRIRQEFHAQSWREFADGVSAQLVAWSDTPVIPAPVIDIVPGRLYGFQRSAQTSIPPLAHSGEASRAGPGWAPPEDWGCRTQTGESRILATAATLADAPARLFLGLRGVRDGGGAWSVMAGGKVLERGHLANGREVWVSMPLSARHRPGGLFDLRLEADDIGVLGFMICAEADLATRTAFAEGLQGGTLYRLATTEAAEGLGP